MESIAININDVTYKKEERSFLSSLRNRLSSKIILPTTINTDNTRCKDFDFNNVKDFKKMEGFVLMFFFFL